MRLARTLRRGSALVLVTALASGVAVVLTVATPAAAADNLGPFTKAWDKVITGKVGQSAPVVAYVGPAHTPAVFVGDLKGHLHGYLVNGTAVPGWSDLVTSATSFDAALSTDGRGHLFAPRTAARGRSVLASYAISNPASVVGAHPCASSNCPTLSGMTYTGTNVYTGGFSQRVYGLTSSTLRDAWSYLNSDTTNSTPAAANLTGHGTEIVMTNDQTGNTRVIPAALPGGHLRIFTPGTGSPACDANIGGGPNPPGSFNSSPAIGSFAAGYGPAIVFGTGLSGTLPNQLMAYNSACQRLWSSPKLAGKTIAAPAIAHTQGANAAPVVIEEVRSAVGQPVVYELNGLTGAVIRSRTIQCTNFAQGSSASVVTADVTADGAQDIIASAGGCGLAVLNGKDLSLIAQLGNGCAVQNTPVVTKDSAYKLGITMAGYTGLGGCIKHFTVPMQNYSADWPEFHHDPQLTGALAQTLGGHDALRTGQRLAVGASLVSANGLYRATMQSNGVFAVHNKSSTAIRWHVSASGRGAYMLVGRTQIALIGSDGRTKWHSPPRSEARPLTLVLGASGKLVLLVHAGNQWANDAVLWAA